MNISKIIRKIFRKSVELSHSSASETMYKHNSGTTLCAVLLLINCIKNQTFQEEKMKKLIYLYLLAASSIASAGTNTSPLVGSWTGSPDCEIKFLQDDGKNVIAVCDNNRFHHKITGFYVGSALVKSTTERLDVKNKCKTTTDSALRIIDSDNLEYLQAGWNGCGVSTSSESQMWKRK